LVYDGADHAYMRRGEDPANRNSVAAAAVKSSLVRLRGVLRGRIAWFHQKTREPSLRAVKSYVCSWAINAFTPIVLNVDWTSLLAAAFLTSSVKHEVG